jgi:hypothetical protein
MFLGDKDICRICRRVKSLDIVDDALGGGDRETDRKTFLSTPGNVCLVFGASSLGGGGGNDTIV